MVAAAYWKKDGEFAACELCPHRCRIRSGERGRCGIRLNLDGSLVAEAFGLISSVAMDPIEKKPLYHVRPGGQILSLGSAGCNFRCAFCQNWSISQARPALSSLPPERVVAAARAENAMGVAYTYNEPLINFEYVLECARHVRAAGLLNVLVSNGYINPEPRAELLPWIDAWNIDLKSIRPEFYTRLCGAQLKPVQDTIRAAVAASQVELTHLIVTGGNDDPGQIADLVDWVATVSPEIPLHFSRYFPNYRWDEPPTPPALLAEALRIGRRKLSWVYIGNLPGQDESTRCPDCGRVLIERHGYAVGRVDLKDGHCPKCGRKVPGIF